MRIIAHALPTHSRSPLTPQKMGSLRRLPFSHHRRPKYHRLFVWLSIGELIDVDGTEYGWAVLRWVVVRVVWA